MIISTRTVIFTLCFSIVPYPSESSCKLGWNYSEPSKTCLKVFHRQQKFKQAKASCRSHGGFLVAILSDAMNEFVHVLLKGRTQHYIGLNDRQKNGEYKWQGSNEIATFFNWGLREPSGRSNINCVATNHPGLGLKKWMDTACTIFYKYICEVCPRGSYGFKCVHNCSRNCHEDIASCNSGIGTCPQTNKDICDGVNGTCFDGCVPGYHGEKCDAVCPNGTFGPNCLKQCSEHCGGTGNLCDHRDGNCTGNCDDGFTGVKCDSTCSKHCGGIGNKCDRNNGKCIYSCDPGYFGPLCKTACSKHCGGTGNTCNRKNGKCIYSCDPGYFGPLCKTACSRHCGGPGNKCDPTDGRCVNACDPGYFTRSCDTACSKHCGGTHNKCYRITGKCTDGCDPGYFGTYCKKACNKHCGGTRNKCDRVLGKCLDGCGPGYVGPYCKTECSHNTYGVNCNRNCSAFCNGSEQTCDTVTGVCYSGCVAGYTGRRCLDKEAEKEKFPFWMIAILSMVFFVLIFAMCPVQESLDHVQPYVEDWQRYEGGAYPTYEDIYIHHDEDGHTQTDDFQLFDDGYSMEFTEPDRDRSYTSYTSEGTKV